MAECLLLKSGGQTKKLPVLNPSYPANVTNWQGEQATFKVEISTPGVPAEYTYQWYRDGAKWTEATNATVSWSGASIGSHSIYCVVTNKAGEVTSRVATLTVKNPNMTYTYSGSHEKIDDGSGNWRIKFKSSGTLKFTNLGKWDGKLDVFCVGGGCAGGSGGTRTVIHFCISKTEHCIRSPHVSVIFDGVIVARKYPFVKTARLIKYAARRKELLSYCTIPIPKARHMAQSPSREAARNTACKCLQHLIQCG